MQTTWQSRCTIPKVPRPFSGNFLKMRLRRATSEACHLVFGCYVINECHDVTCDVIVLHVYRSCDLLL